GWPRYGACGLRLLLRWLPLRLLLAGRLAEAPREYRTHQKRRGDEHDDERLDDADQVNAHAGVDLHLPSTGFERAEQQSRDQHADRVRAPKQGDRYGIEADAGREAGGGASEHAEHLVRAGE